MATITFDDQEIPVPELGFASEATLRRLAGVSSGASGGVKGLGTSSNTTAKSLDDLRRSADALEDKYSKTTIGFDALGGAIMGTTGLLKGVMGAKRQFSDLNPVIDIATASIQNFANLVPIFGGFLSGVAGATGEVLKFKLEIMDVTLETFQSLQQLGVQFNSQVGTTDDLIQQILKAQISLGSFNEVLGQNLEGIVAFGGAADLGARKFLSQLDQLTDPLSDAGMQLRSMGLNSEAISEAFGDFIQTNRFNAKMMSLEEGQLRQQLVQRIKNERIITELTGLDVKEQRARIAQSAQEAGLQAAIMDMDAKSAYETTQFVSTLNGPLRDAFIGTLTDFGIVNEEALKLISFLPDVGRTIESLQQRLESGDITAAEAREELNRVLAKSSTDETVRNLLLIDAARGTQDFISIFQDAYLEGRRYVSQMDLLNNINEKYGQGFTNADTAAQYFLDQVDVSSDEFRNAMLKVKDALTEQDITALQQMSGKERFNYLKTLKGLDSETGNTLAAMSSLNDEMLSLIQAKVFEGVGGDLESFATILGDVYDTVTDKLGLRGVDSVQVQADKLNADLTNADVTLDMGTANAVIMKNIQQYQEKSPFIDQNFLGGSLFPGRMSMVGERGPELLAMGNSMGEVVNNATSSEIMGAAAGIVESLRSGNTTATGPTNQPMTTEIQRVVNNMSDDLLKQMIEILNQSNMIQSNMLKETKRAKRFDY